MEKEIKVGMVVTKQILYAERIDFKTRPQPVEKTIYGVVKEIMNEWSVLVTWAFPYPGRFAEDQIIQKEKITILNNE